MEGAFDSGMIGSA